MQVRKQQLELEMEQQTCSKLGTECVKAVYCHSAYLNYAEYIMRNGELDDAQAGIKIAGEISTTSDMQMIPLLMAESEEELKSLLMRMKEESEKAGLKLSI